MLEACLVVQLVSLAYVRAVVPVVICFVYAVFASSFDTVIVPYYTSEANNRMVGKFG